MLFRILALKVLRESPSASDHCPRCPSGVLEDEGHGDEGRDCVKQSPKTMWKSPAGAGKEIASDEPNWTRLREGTAGSDQRDSKASKLGGGSRRVADSADDRNVVREKAL